MKKTFIILAAAALAAIVSCSKQKEEFNNTEEILTRVSVSLDNTKTSLSGTGSTRKVYWSNGDAININGNASNALTGIESKESSAEFSFGVVLDTPYNVLYPASDYKSASTITLPSEQAAADGTFADGSMPMYAYSTTNAVASMSHLCGVLEVNLTGSATIAFVQVTGGNSEQMSGDFTIDYQTGDLTATSTATADLKVKTLVDKTLSGTATPVYVVIPARTYSNGLTLRIVDEDGNYMDKTISGSRTVTAGHLAKLPSLAFSAEGTLITTAAQWNAFAAKVNGGTSDTPAEIGADIVLSGDYAVTADYEGTVNGNGYTLSGITTPLFANVLAGGAINNLTVDGTLTTATSGEYFGILAKVNAGTISNCTVTGSINLDGLNIANLYIGGMVGKNTGTMYMVRSEVAITVVQSTAGTESYIGGICAELSDEGTIKGNYDKVIPINEYCVFEASALTVKDANATVYVGGIVAYHKSTATAPAVFMVENRTPIIVKDNYPTTLHLGGVIGRTTVAEPFDRSWNWSAINVGEKVATLAALKKGTFRIGGVVGSLEGNLSKFGQNHGIITAYAMHSGMTAICVGGVIGYATGTVSNSTIAQHLDAGINFYICDHTGTDMGNTYYAVGGIIGGAKTTKVDKVNNDGGYINVSGFATGSGAGFNGLGIGGVLGYNEQTKSKFTLTACKNKGAINVSFPVATSSKRGIMVGGIAGYLECAKQMTINNNSVTANITADVLGLDWSSTKRQNYACGGIAGVVYQTADVGSTVGNTSKPNKYTGNIIYSYGTDANETHHAAIAYFPNGGICLDGGNTASGKISGDNGTTLTNITSSDYAAGTYTTSAE